MIHLRSILVLTLTFGITAPILAQTPDVSSPTVSESLPIPQGLRPDSEKPIRTIHVTSWQAGSTKYRKYLDDMFKETVVNSVTIDIKEYQGEVFIPGVTMVQESGAYVPAIPDLKEWLADLKKRGIYTIARQVVFKDNIIPRKHPKLGVHNPQGELWYDRRRVTWMDPYNKEAWRYNLVIALQASELGFDEVQFDYIRFPTDGNLASIRYAKPYSRATASQALVEFLGQARQLLHPRGTKISIDVFGLTTSDNSGMGIGQLIVPMTEQVDYVCPMIYPSHYAHGEYRIPNPNSEPYKIVRYALRDAIKALGAQAPKLRPYLQDFTLGPPRYGKTEVFAQIQAAADLGVLDWSLWNPRGIYTLTALKALPTASNSYQVVTSTH